VKYNIAGAGLVGKALADIFPRQGMRALIANPRGPKSRAEMAAEQFQRTVGLEKKWFSPFGPDGSVAWQPADLVTHLNLSLLTPRGIIFRAALDW
jgi:NAD(P)-dependent dehydrogenase (short-subunit alcohol dehydrogenase family)